MNFEDFFTLIIPILTRILETPVAQPNQEYIQEYREDSTNPKSIHVFYHALNTVLKIKKHEVVTFSKWMKYMGYNNFTDLHVDLFLN